MLDTTPKQLRYAKGFQRLTASARAWSERTFGPPADRGPAAPADHMQSEASEVAANPGDIVSYADQLILLNDQIWRAGFEPEDVVEAALAKMSINKDGREWPEAGSTPADKQTNHTTEEGDEVPVPPFVDLNGHTQNNWVYVKGRGFVLEGNVVHQPRQFVKTTVEAVSTADDTDGARNEELTQSSDSGRPDDDVVEDSDTDDKPKS